MNVLTTLVNQQSYREILALLSAYNNKLTAAETYTKGQNIKPYQDIEKAYDLLNGVYASLGNQNDKVVLLALASKGLHIDRQPYCYNEEDYKRSWLKHEGTKSEYHEDYQRFSNHPFIVSLRDDLCYVPRDRALNQLSDFWNSGHRKGFLFVYDALLGFQNRQQRATDPQFSEESFADQIVTHPGLEVVIMDIRRGTSRGLDFTVEDLPELRLLVSNKAKPTECIDNDTTNVDGWAKGADLEPDFQILTAHGSFNSLKDYLRASLSKRSESVVHGPYLYNSNDDRSYPTAGNVLAAIHSFLRVPENFKAPAQNLLRAQISDVKTTSLNKIYSYRFLRTQNWSDWAAALVLGNSKRQRKGADEIGYRQATKILVTHGYTDTADFMSQWADEGTLEEIQNGTAQQIQATLGFKEGIEELFGHMKDLYQSSDVLTPSLDWYENERGFHPDVMNLSIAERKKLAFRDISDLVTAALTGHNMMGAYTYTYRNEPSIEEMIEIYNKTTSTSNEADSLLYRIAAAKENLMLLQVPISKIVQLMIKANDVTNFMRIYTFIDATGLTGGGSKIRVLLAEQIKDKITQGGFHVMPKMVINDLNKMAFDLVIDHAGTAYIRTEKMIHYKSADQMILDNEFLNPIALKIRLENLKFPEALQENANRQIDNLKKHITDYAYKAEFKEAMREMLADVPVPARAGYLEMIKIFLPVGVTEMFMKDGVSDVSIIQEEIGRAQSAFDAVTANPPRFARVVRAANAVAGLFTRRRGGPSI